MTTLILAALLAAPAWAAPAAGVDFDADPMADLRRLLPGGLSPQADAAREEAAQPPKEPAPRPAPPAAPRAPERAWRRITGTPNDPLHLFDRPLCDPRRGLTAGCEILDPFQARPRGGYYYGLIRGADGKLRYGKLYLPHYGDFDGLAHNDPPDAARPRVLPRIRRDPPPQE